MESGDSCSSSSVSSQEHSTEETTWEDCQGTQPYLFEPYDSEASSDTDSTNESDEEDFERLQNTQGHPTDRFGKLSVRKTFNPL